VNTPAEVATTQVPSCDLVAQYLAIRPELDAAIAEVLLGGEFERDQHLWDFEDEFARSCGVAHGVGVGSGLAAVMLSLKALGIGPGDEVITVPNTDIATCAAITHAGAQIVWSDVDERTHNLDPEKVEQLITARTKAILAVSLYGLPADMPRLRELADRYHLWLVGDAALAYGAAIDDIPVGALADVSCFSFAPRKVLGAYGDGGMVVTQNPAVATKVRHLAGYGEPRRDGMADKDGRIHVEVEGYHVHLDVLQAAILRVKLPHVPAWVSRRQEIAASYAQLLSGGTVELPFVPQGFTHVFRSFVVRVPHRDEVYRRLAARGIETSLLYTPPLHLQTAYRRLGRRVGDFPVVESLANSLLCLPMYPELPDESVQFVASELLDAVASCR
jgi:dTDP-4-amino-4,6-dideoxygalactose transaminase